jgi:hypothetical protein
MRTREKQHAFILALFSLGLPLSGVQKLPQTEPIRTVVPEALADWAIAARLTALAARAALVEWVALAALREMLGVVALQEVAEAAASAVRLALRSTTAIRARTIFVKTVCPFIMQRPPEVRAP